MGAGFGDRKAGAVRRRASLCLLAVAAMVVSGCSLRRLAVGALADALATSGDVFASDPDPELVRDAMPFALETLEALLAESPDHPGLRLAACRGFTSYAWAFVETDAELASDDFHAAERLRDRALGLYLRGRDHGLYALDLAVPGTSERLSQEPKAAAAAFGRERVAELYWAGAAWGAAIALGKDRPELVADLGAVRALLERVLALDPAYERGAAHEAMIVFESLGGAYGGSPQGARRHFEQALELSGGRKATPYVTFAESVAVAAQDRRGFGELLEQALALDPDAVPELRLANLVAQRRARALLARADQLFFADLPETP